MITISSFKFFIISFLFLFYFFLFYACCLKIYVYSGKIDGGRVEIDRLIYNFLA